MKKYLGKERSLKKLSHLRQKIAVLPSILLALSMVLLMPTNVSPSLFFPTDGNQGSAPQSAFAQDQVAQIIVSPTEGLITTENGGTDTFIISLTVEPTAPVKIVIRSSDASEGTANLDQAVFNSGNWAPKTVTVTGVDDFVKDGDVEYTILTAPADSTDPNYRGIDPANVQVTNLDNEILTANDDNDVTSEDTPVTTNVLANDQWIIGEVDLTVVSGPSNGSAVVTGDNRITYTPKANYYGSDSYQYGACDESGDCDSAQVKITITAVNDPPVAEDDIATTPEDTPITINVLQNDYDVDGDNLTISSVTQPSSGTVTITADNRIRFEPKLNFYGNVSFTYTISDGNGGSDTARVDVTVTPVNDPPVAVNDTATTKENTPITVNVRSNDSDPDGDTLFLESFDVNTEAGGTVIRDTRSTPETSDDRLIYTPPFGFTGSDSFTYTISDGEETDVGTVFISVVEDPNAPIANDDTYTAFEDAQLTVNEDDGVLSNDIGADIAAELVNNATNGSLDLEPDGSFTYTPDPDYNGTDTFTYQACDTTPSCSFPATVTINVTEGNSPPIANPDTYDASQDETLSISAPGLLNNDTDADGNTLTVVESIKATASGSVTINTDGSFDYTPNPGFVGQDTFTYRAYDGQEYSNPGLVTINVLDTVKPVVHWELPVKDEERYDVWNEVVTLEVEATDNISVKYVELFRWDAVRNQYILFAKLKTSPYRYNLDSTILNYEWNQVFAKAYDEAGNEASRVWIWIFRNGVSTLDKFQYLPVVAETTSYR